MIVSLVLSGVLLLVAGLWLRLAKREVSMPIWSTLDIPELAEDESPMVSVVVAGSRAQGIEGCLRSLLRQDYPKFEVIAVDAHADDGVWEQLQDLERAAQGSLRLLRGEPIPQGWGHEAALLRQGIDSARGHWLLLTAGDTYHAPNLLSRAMAYARLQGLGMLSLAARQECRTFWEHVWQPLALQYLDFSMPMERVGQPATHRIWASESFLLVSRAAYMQAGGYPAVASDGLPECALMRRVKSVGYRVEFVKAMDLLQARTYRSLRELWEGWSKRLYFVLGAHPLPLVAHAFVLWTCSVLPFAALVPAFSFGFWGLDMVQGWWDIVLAVCTILAVVTILQAQSVLRRVQRQNHLYTATLPLGGLCLGAAALTATLRSAAWEKSSQHKGCVSDTETLSSHERY